MLCNIRIQENISKHQVIIVDKVYEAETNKARMLINPYIVVIQQDEVLESYKLKHIKVSLWSLINVYIYYTRVYVFVMLFLCIPRRSTLKRRKLCSTRSPTVIIPAATQM